MRLKSTNGSKVSLPELHRLKAARLNAGISLRAMARRMKVPVSVAKNEEEGKRDLYISDLHRWQEALQVPLHELIEPPKTSLSEPIRQRACMIRLAKTAKTLLRTCSQQRQRRLAERLVDQLEELMPELEEVGVWPEGTGRSRDDLGRVGFEITTSDWHFPVPVD